MKKIFSLLIVAIFCWSCTRTKPVVVLFDNDVHCAIDGYVRMAGLRDSFRTTTPYVSLVSAGDWAQGDVIGSLTEGQAIVRVLNAVGYDFTTLGNHEFDYSVTTLRANSNALKAEVLCCNIDGPDGPLYAPYHIVRYGSTKVGFVGVATPLTYNSSTPTYFQDSLGRVVYNFHVTDTYTCIQQAVDEVRAKGAEYVVLLSHLGDDSEVSPSPDMIAHTRGIDVVLDGHAHHIFNTAVANMDGDSVLFASTGTKFQNVGVLTLSVEGKWTIELRPSSSITVTSASVEAVVNAEKEALAERTNRVVGYSEVELRDRDENDERLVRCHQMPIGHFLCDAWRYVADAQIGIMNGGGIRASLPAGNITTGHVMGVLPFNNRIWKMSATGQQILDALEVGATICPQENGDYPQCTGLRYKVHTDVPTSVVLDDNLLYQSIGKTRRVYAVEVENADGSWSPINPESTYTVAGQSYIMRSSGASGMFRHFEVVDGPLMTDVDAVLAYLQYLNDTISASRY